MVWCMEWGVRQCGVGSEAVWNVVWEWGEAVWSGVR